MVRVLMASVFFVALSCAAIHTLAQTPTISGPDNSPFNYFRLADSCSKRGDSICASKYFLQIDAYYFMSYWGAAPHSLVPIYDEFSLTAAARARYGKIFDSVYLLPRSKAFRRFGMMYKQDQAIRARLSNSIDSFPDELGRRMMKVVDSPHFEALYKYVKAKGWPTLQNGSLYAEIIAIHDHERHGYYLPIVAQAVRDGKLPEATYKTIYNLLVTHKR